MVSREKKTGQFMTKTLFLLMWIQLLHLAWADEDLGSLTPYGQAQKDTQIQIQEGSSINSSLAVHLHVPFKFTGKMYDTVHLTENGVITLEGAHPEDTKTSWDNIPQSLPLSTAHPLIAAFWTNPQSIQQGNLWFRQTMHVKELNNIKLKVECLYPQNKDLVAKWAFIATWANVSSQTDLQLTNTFQVVLVNIEDYSYLLFQYGHLTWNSWEMPDNGTTKSGIQAAVAGYNGGDGISYSTLPGSTTRDILNVLSDSNVNVPGLWIFRVDQSQEPCVQKGLALMLLLVVLLTLLTGIVIGLLLAWCCWKWKHKLNDYEDLDAETQKDPESENPDPVVHESTEEFMFILEPEVSSATMAPVYTSNADVDPQNKLQEIPRRKLIVIKKH